MTEQQTVSIWVRLCLYLMLTNLGVSMVGISGRILLDWPPLTVFHLFFYGAQLGLVLSLVGLIQLLFGFFKKQKPHLGAGALTLVLGLTPLALALLVVGVAGFKAPMIHDISTDLHNPPEYSITNSLRTAAENSLVYAGDAIASQQQRAFPDIQPLLSSLSVEDARAQSLRTVEALGWTLVVSDESTGSIEAYDKSRVFGFIDDVVIRISAVDDGSRIDVRSNSRVGLGDLGANANRIRRFFQHFAQ